MLKSIDREFVTFLVVLVTALFYVHYSSLPSVVLFFIQNGSNGTEILKTNIILTTTQKTVQKTVQSTTSSSLKLQPQKSPHFKNFNFDYQSSIVYMVVSARENFALRSAIRSSWAQNKTNIVIIIGKDFCPIPTASRTFWYKCELNPEITENQYFLNKYLKEQQEINEKLLEEQRKFRDIILLEDVIDVYHNLSRKELRGFNFVHDNFKNLKWLVKLDDDVYPNDFNLKEFLKLNNRMQEGKPVIAGSINSNVRVRNGKYEQWDEKNYAKKYYPLYPMGGFYIISKMVLDFIGENYLNLKEYVIEDAALGIWVDEWIEKEKMREDFIWVSERLKIDLSGRFAGCPGNILGLAKKMAIGHRLTGEDLRTCHEKFYKLQSVEGYGMSPRELAKLKESKKEKI